jgi:NitT/TauT family transport system substrate-binding protein
MFQRIPIVHRRELSDIRPPCGLQIGLCLLALSLLSCSVQPANNAAADHANSTANSRIELNVCTSSTTGTHVVFVYAIEKGIFAKYGLDVTVISMDSGSHAVAALISGSVPLCQISGPAVVYAAVAGADVAIVGGLVNTYVYSLMVPAGIRSPSNLKGKSVAISSPGSASETSMRLALRTLGLQPDRDVTVLAIGGQGERMAAMEAGYVAGTLVSPPETTLARQKGFHVLLDMSAMDLPDLHTGIVTSRAFIERNRPTVLNFMKAIGEAVFLIKRDKNSTLDVLSKLLQLDRQKDGASLEETYDVLLKGKLVDIPYPSLAAIEAVLAEIAHENPSAARFKPEQVADMGIIRELENKGFFRDLALRK